MKIAEVTFIYVCEVLVSCNDRDQILTTLEWAYRLKSLTHEDKVLLLSAVLDATGFGFCD